LSKAPLEQKQQFSQWWYEAMGTDLQPPMVMALAITGNFQGVMMQEVLAQRQGNAWGGRRPDETACNRNGETDICEDYYYLARNADGYVFKEVVRKQSGGQVVVTLFCARGLEKGHTRRHGVCKGIVPGVQQGVNIVEVEVTSGGNWQGMLWKDGER
jgi:hypothetical protein